MDESQEIRLAFIDITSFSDGSLRGGLLTTDAATRPFEFRVTSPIRPTSIQQILYGNSLKDYVYSELICVPLVKATKEKISLILVKEGYLISMRPLLSVPVIYLQSGDLGDGEETKQLKFATHRNYPKERSFAQEILASIMQQHDLLEPFERIRLAINEVQRTGLGQAIKSE